MTNIVMVSFLHRRQTAEVFKQFLEEYAGYFHREVFSALAKSTAFFDHPYHIMLQLQGFPILSVLFSKPALFQFSFKEYSPSGMLCGTNGAHFLTISTSQMQFSNRYFILFYCRAQQ